jgi:peptidoglycan hydrolase-like protein with peptidoglycan-binding domain
VFAFVASPAVSYAANLYRQLDLGMSGSDVGTLQTFLAQDPTIYPQGLVTSYFGSLTQSAVSNFQVRNGLDSVGRVGPQTLVAINSQMAGGSTSGSDVNAPTISSVKVNASRNTATIDWDTSEGSTATIFYNDAPISLTEGTAFTDVNVSGTRFLAHSDFQTSHDANLTDLDSDTKYYYVVYVKDAAGNESLTWPQTFNTDN